MTRRGVYGSDYSQEARERLGNAAEEARRALGYRTRPAFKKASGIGLRSLEKIELGEPGVGPDVYDRLQRALPGWNSDTVKVILEGGPIPPVTPRPPTRVDVQWHTRDEIAALLSSGADAKTFVRRLSHWRRQFKAAGLSDDDLLSVSEDALKGQ